MKKNINHIGIIVDGNGRWASKKGLPRSEGHKAGAKALESIILYVAKNKIANVLSLYVFSTENFKRSDTEVNYLMDLFLKWFKKAKKKYLSENIKVLFSSNLSLLSESVVKSIKELEDSTKNNTGLIVNFCLGYGAREELTNACKNIAQDVIDKKINVNNINECLLSKYMYQELPDIDFLIRTSGEQRLSNFMLYQASYAELYFPSIYFPDFTPEELNKAINEYYKRDRRFGKENSWIKRIIF